MILALGFGVWGFGSGVGGLWFRPWDIGKM